MIRVVTCGYFDPLHVGHIECFEKANELGDYLIVIINNDKQAALKKANLLCVKKTGQKLYLL